MEDQKAFAEDPAKDATPEQADPKAQKDVASSKGASHNADSKATPSTSKKKEKNEKASACRCKDAKQPIPPLAKASQEVPQ